MPGSKISPGREHYKLSAFSTLPIAERRSPSAQEW